MSLSRREFLKMGLVGILAAKAGTLDLSEPRRGWQITEHVGVLVMNSRVFKDDESKWDFYSQFVTIDEREDIALRREGYTASIVVYKRNEDREYTPHHIMAEVMYKTEDRELGRVSVLHRAEETMKRSLMNLMPEGQYSVREFEGKSCLFYDAV